MQIKTDAAMDGTMLLNQCLEALGLVLEFNTKDFLSHQHAIRVGEGCVLIGEKLGLGPRVIQKMYYAGLLHDVGKISVDPKLLAKKGKLTEEEFELIKEHTRQGSRIIATLPGMSELALWIRWHHEWWNGRGYPDKLAGNEIPVEVQILSVMDCFDSLQTPRPDRDRLSPEAAYDIIQEGSGSQFNPDILNLVLELIEEKTLIPGKSSERFLELKRKYVDLPFTNVDGKYWKISGITEIYPILRLFARVIDAKHKYTRGHSTRVSILSKLVAEKMGLRPEELALAEVAGLLHDAGKVSVPVEILDKPGRPSDEEWAIIKGHPGHSLDILSTIPALREIAALSVAHHEKQDGTGYPGHLKGDEIPLLSRIIAVADTYDAITSTRSYRQGQPPELAYKIINKELGAQFNSDVGGIFLDIPPKHILALFDIYEVKDI
jgi:HD-GYP domain-containing protein (c-di-GMP phosphodiesterase class II)